MISSINSSEKSISNLKNHFFAGISDILFASRRSIWMMLEILIVSCSFFYFWWKSPYLGEINYDKTIFTLALIYTISFVCFSLGLGQYERFRRLSYLKILVNSFLATLPSIILTVAVAYFYYHGFFGRLTLLAGAAGSLVLVVCQRFLIAFLFSCFPYRFGIVGRSDVIEEISEFIVSGKAGESKNLKFVRFDDDILLTKLWSELDETSIYDLVVNEKFCLRSDFQAALIGLARRGINIVDERVFFEDIFERVSLNNFSAKNLIMREYDNRRFFGGLVKRTTDIVVSLAGIILLSPLLLFIALAIKLSSPGPIMFLQPRQGRANSSFLMFKFRTMDASKSSVSAAGGFTAKNDQRVTLIGRIIRPLHLDELPQLFNIFIGQMSIIGPRPEALRFAQRMANEVPQYSLRYIMRPGLTGHAQLMAGYMMDNVNDTRVKLSFDLFYILNHSLAMDIRIFIRTVFVVLKKAIKNYF